MLKGTLCLYGMSQVCHSMLSRPPPFRFITRVAPHCDNTLMIQHVAQKTRSYRAKLSPGIGEHILAEIDAETLHLGEEAVHLRRRGVVVGVVFGAEEAAVAVSVLSSLSLSYSITTVVLSLLLTYTLLLGWHPTVSDTLRILNAAYDATR